MTPTGLVRSRDGLHAGVTGLLTDRTGGTRPVGTACCRQRPVSEPSVAQVRAWAKAQGLAVAASGRLPDSVVRAYRAAHPVDVEAPETMRTTVRPPGEALGTWQDQYRSRAQSGWPLDESKPPPPRGTNGWSVAALVLALLGAGPVAVLCGVFGVRQTRRTGQAGRGLAIGGLVLGSLGTLAFAALLLTDTPAQRAESGALLDAGRVPLADLRTGDCLTELPFDSPDDPVAVQPCQGVHAAEVFSAFESPGNAYPGPDPLQRVARTECEQRLRQVRLAAPLDVYDVLTIVPSRERWADGDRRTHCLITGTAGTLTDSELVAPVG